MHKTLVIIFTLYIFLNTHLAHAGFILPQIKGGERVNNNQLEVTQWPLALAKYQKVNGIWRVSEELYLDGQLSRSTYLLKNKDLFSNIATYYNTWTKLKSTETLFSCKARSCGSSNEWANSHFGVSRLYGIDGKQRYWALKSGNEYIAMYLVERGNGQKYLQIDWLKPSIQTVPPNK